jgi:DNA-binding CsgD family transcriptional regulator/tetratricopeptide (TPR) repeat protein
VGEEYVPRFRGRARELAVLTEAFDSARSGRAGAVLVAGDGGVGKTRLTEELARYARRHGAVVLTGSAVDIADAPPFWPVLSAIRNAARADPGVATGVLHQWLTGLPPAGGAGPPVVLLDLLHRLVVDLAECHPVLLVVDDLQWADRSTRDLVAYLVANLVREPVLVLATFRTDSPRRAPDLDVALAELRRLRKVATLEVAPLPRDALAALVADWAPDRPELETLVWQRSMGNVFIAEETVRAVLGGDAHGLPSTLREIVLARIALLSPAAQQVVRALAIAVGPLRHRLLADVVDLEPETLLIAVRDAMAHGAVRVDDGGDAYLLRHGLLTEVVAADLPPGERIALHRRTALALARDGDPCDPGTAGRLAHHWYKADDPERALAAAAAAARASEAVHAHTHAHRHWLRAAELVDRARTTNGLRRSDCLDRAGRAAALAGDHDQAVALLDRLLDDPTAGAGLPSALLRARKGGALAAAGRAADAERSYRAAAALLPASGAEAERAQVLAGYGAALLQALDFTAARTVALEALELARGARAHTVEARVLAVVGFSSAFLDDAEAGAAAIDEAVRVAERTGEPDVLGEAYLRRAELLTGPLNRLVEGIAYACDGVQRMHELGLARTHGVALLTHAANALFRLGRWDEAERLVAQAWELVPAGAAALDVRLARCRITLGRGLLDDAAADLEVVELLSRPASGPRQRIPLLVLFAALELWRRDPARALRHAEDGLALAEAGAGDIWSLAPMVWHGTRAWADLVAAGGPAPAPTHVERLRRHCAELDRRATAAVPAVRAVVEAFTLMCAAEAARAEQRPDPDLWERAAGMWESHEHPYPAAYARLRQAEAMLERNPRSTAAADVLRGAERAVRQLGAQPLLDDVVDLAARARVPLSAGPPPEAPVAPAPRTPLDGLTGREREVLEELAKGLTNREIGRRLYISEKTVGVHVTRIFHKFGVHTRVQASAVLQRSRPAPGEP